MSNEPDQIAARDGAENSYDRWAAFYDLGEGDRAPYLEFYRGLLKPTTRSVLEIGCGTGVVTSGLVDKLLRNAGSAQLRICGVDSSGPMLDLARARDARVEWLQADMRDLPLAETFDLVFCCFNTFQFMLSDTDLLTAFRAARRHTAAGGEFAFDLYQPNIPYLVQARTNTLARSLAYQGRDLEIREDSSYEPTGRILDLDWRLVDVAADCAVLAETHFRIRQYFHADIQDLLSQAGFEIEQCFGGLNRQAFDAESKKQVLVCRPV